MTASTINRRKIIPACFRYVTQYQMKRLNDALEVTLTSSLTDKRTMKKFSFLPNSSPVQAFRPLQAKFYKTFKHFQNQRGTNSASMHGKIVGGVCPIFKIYGQNEIQRRHNIIFLFSCSEDIKLSYQRQSFCLFEADENNRKCA